MSVVVPERGPNCSPLERGASSALTRVSGCWRRPRERLAALENVELVLGDARTVDVRGPFDGVLVGGLLMYLDRADVVSLLARLAGVAPGGRIILRESGVRSGVELRGGDYPVAYRSVHEYQTLAAEAGLRVVEVERNRGYAHMEIAVNVVDHLRRVPVLRGIEVDRIGRPVWRTLQASASISLDLLPRAIEAVGVDWPHLTNHFVLLEPR